MYPVFLYHNKTTAAAKPPKSPAPTPATLPAFGVAAAEVAEEEAELVALETLDDTDEAALEALEDAASTADVAVAVLLLDTQETLSCIVLVLEAIPILQYRQGCMR